MRRPSYVTIDFNKMAETDLTINEYALACIIYNLSTNPSRPGCSASYSFLGDAIKVNKSTIARLIAHLVRKGFVEQNATNNLLFTTSKWYEICVAPEKTPLQNATPSLKSLQNATISLQNATPTYKYMTRKELSVVSQKKQRVSQSVPTQAQTDTVLDTFNSVMHTKYHNAKVWASNFQYWLTIYTLDDILRAIANIPHHPFWRDKMTPEILFRTKNPAREPVDYIGTLLYVKAPKKLLDGYTAL